MNLSLLLNEWELAPLYRNDNLAYLTALFGEEMGIRNIMECEFLSNDRMYITFLNQRHHVADLTRSWIVAVESRKIHSGRNILNRVKILKPVHSA